MDCGDGCGDHDHDESDEIDPGTDNQLQIDESEDVDNGTFEPSSEMTCALLLLEVLPGDGLR